MRVLLTIDTRPCRRAVAIHAVTGQATDGFPAKSQPVGIAFWLLQVEDPLPEPSQLLGIAALQDQLGQLADRHLFKLVVLPPQQCAPIGRSAHHQRQMRAPMSQQDPVR